MNIRINVLCLVGVLLGAVAAYLPWFTVNSVFGNRAYAPIDALLWVLEHHSYGGTLLWAFLLFLAGVFIAAISPLGGLAQTTGIGLFFWDYVRRFNEWPQNFEDTLALSYGAYSVSFPQASL